MAQRTCLLIDDDPDDQEVFSMAVKQISPETELVVFSEAEDALLYLRQAQTLPDIIFVDLNMPRVDGYEFLVRIKRETKSRRVPVIVYSTSADERDRDKTRKLGAHDF